MRRPNILPARRGLLRVQSAPNRSLQSAWRNPTARNCSCTAAQQPQSSTQPAAANTPSHDTPPTPPAPDHRALGTAQQLFTTSVYSPGSPLFLPNGTHILNKLTSFLRAQYSQYGFREVLTPSIYKKSLWEVSGHWQNYKDDMYEVRGRGASGEAKDGEIGEDESYGLKPMNCPGHCLLFKSQNHSYRELPIRYADFSPLHRNEISGSLSGLTRVRRFHQDDGHIFCRPQQIGSEIESALRFTDTVMNTFGFRNYRLVLSTRPEKDFIGSLELWDSAERQLRDALEKSGRPWEMNEGDGAFYGPKIDMQVQDSDGKFHQLSTIQLDMNLPERFGLEYDVAEGEEDYNPETPGKARPVMIHRAIFGSLERFFALLIENHPRRWPFWLSPRQGIILAVNQDEKLLQAVKDAAAKMSGLQVHRNGKSGSGEPLKPLSAAHATFRIDVDTSSRNMKKKVREAKEKGYNLIFVLGNKNLPDGSVDVELTGQTLGKGMEGTKMLLQDTPCWDVKTSGNSEARNMKIKIDDVYGWLLRQETEFL
ncbi:hypothetical protein FQN51_008243 [Onygenales sp. PD_10]|nr:hypothetical protein FQN51_008243 [Onygenales sp. PD_10]